MSAAVATTVVRRGHDMNHAAQNIQRIFRGHRARRERHSKVVINPAQMLDALARHDRERKGFVELFCYVVFVSLFLIIAISRSHPASRFEFESGISTAIKAVASPSGVTVDSVATTDDAYELIEAMFLQFYAVGDGEVLLGKGAPSGPPMSLLVPALRELDPNIDPQSPQGQRILNASLVLLPSIRDTDTEFGFSCKSVLDTAKAPTGNMAVDPSLVAAQVTLSERAATTGSPFPDVEHGAGEFLGYSRFTGALLLEQVRRQEAKCVLGEHAGVFHECFSAEDPNHETFEGEYSGTDYTLSEHGAKFYQLFDMGTFGMGIKLNQCLLETLKLDEWLGQHTHSLTISMNLLNGNVQLIGRGSVTFEFALGGRVSSNLEVQSIVIPANDILNAYGVWEFILTLVFMICVVVKLLRVCIAMCKTKKVTFWNGTDVAMLLLFCVMEGINISLTSKAADLKTPSATDIMGAPDPFEVLIDNNSKVVTLAELETASRLVTSIAFLLVLLRLLKEFQFHDRLAVITRTLQVGANDLFHFGIIFFSVTALYSAVAMNSFGSLLESYHTFSTAYTTLMRMLLGDFDYPGLVTVSPVIGPLVFWSYAIVVFYLLTNVFLSIIVDAYIMVKEASSDSSGFFTSLVETSHAALWELKERMSGHKNSVVPTAYSGVTIENSSYATGSPSRTAAGAASSGDRPTLVRVMTERTKAVMSSTLNAPVRSKALAALLKRMASQAEARNTPSNPVELTRLDVRKAIGVRYSKHTVSEIMRVFGRVTLQKEVDSDKMRQLDMTRRARFQQKAIMLLLRQLDSDMAGMTGRARTGVGGLAAPVLRRRSVEAAARGAGVGAGEAEVKGV